MLARLLALACFLSAMSASALAADTTIKPGGVLVFGGAGRLGAEIVKILAARGEHVTVFARPSTARERLAGLPVSYVEGDAMTAIDVDAAFAQAKPRTAINALASGGRGKVGFWNVTQKNITAAAKKSGAKQVVFLSSVGVGDSAGAYSAAALERGRQTLAERFEAEEDLKASGLDYMIIRTGIIAPEPWKATGKAYLTEDRSVLAPVSRPDLALLVADCLPNPACRNKTYASADDTIKLGPSRR